MQSIAHTEAQSIIIRRTTPDDGKSLAQMYESANVYPMSSQLPYPKLSYWTARYENVPDNHYSYVAVVQEQSSDGINEQVVGHLEVTLDTNARRRHIAEFGMAVRDDQHGQGIGTKLMQTLIDLADNWLNIHRLQLGVITDNTHAIALYKKFGFVIEGEAVDSLFRNGEYVNSYHMARIKSAQP